MTVKDVAADVAVDESSFFIFQFRKIEFILVIKKEDTNKICIKLRYIC